jgi:phage terminase small subunit
MITAKAIREHLKELSLYEPAFETAIKSLAQVMADLKAARKTWEDYKEIYDDGKGGLIESEGSLFVITDPKSGKLVRNPYYQVVFDLRKQSLRYLTALGLTADGKHKVTGKIPAPPEPHILSKFDNLIKLVR